MEDGYGKQAWMAPLKSLNPSNRLCFGLELFIFALNNCAASPTKVKLNP